MQCLASLASLKEATIKIKTASSMRSTEKLSVMNAERRLAKEPVMEISLIRSEALVATVKTKICLMFL